ncbi:hypothetical protein HK105_203009 [Polyrhizophydium stewartii]|uniref:FHA domain-containing protein n=1 Tax=Polyrhizophydium stewartii TaxID=2732419 RepID=A0ABR4NCU1_9FUNG|nr:Kanadaptin [Polyrhizophydium stewartii]
MLPAVPQAIKGGAIVDQTPLFRQEYIVFGRLPVCDVPLDHQSISRYHAVIQFKTDGSAFIYDLGSSHGTFLNKVLLPKREFRPIRAGDMVRFGQSTRVHILMGPEQEQPEIAFKTTLAPTRPRAEPDPPEDTGVTWGFAEDAYEGDEFAGKDIDMSAIDIASIDPNAFYFADPRKALRVWFESRGDEMAFQYEEEGPGAMRTYTARIELPVETGMGTLSATGRAGRKRDAERNACLEACAKLDKLGVLRGSGAEAAERQKKRMRELYGEDDDDQDTFYDRTMTEGKKAKNKGSAQQDKVETFDSLTAKRAELVIEIEQLRERIQQAASSAQQPKDAEDGQDELDKFMSTVNKSIQSESTAADEKLLKQHEAEIARLDKLIKLVKPAELDLKPGSSFTRSSSAVSATASISASASASPAAAASPAAGSPTVTPALSPSLSQPKPVFAVPSPVRTTGVSPKSPSLPPRSPSASSTGSAAIPVAIPTKGLISPRARTTSMHAPASPVRLTPPLASPPSPTKAMLPPPAGTAPDTKKPAPPTKRRKFTVPTMDQMARHDIETEDVFDSAAGAGADAADDAEIARRTAAYGY